MRNGLYFFLLILISSSYADTDPAEGRNIYEQHCVICHEDGVAGAPKFRSDNDWQSRIKEKNLDALTRSAIKGLNAMPPKGTCQECSDKDIEAAIACMVPTS